MPRFFNLSLPAVMGIINVNNQSFYQSSRARSLKAVLTKTEAMLKAGAHIIDIGAQSTQPQALPIAEVAEWTLLERILPELPKHFPEAVFSVDTFFASIAMRALDCGFQMINDVSAGLADPEMLTQIASYDPFLVCMHWTRLDKNPEALFRIINRAKSASYSSLMQSKQGVIIPRIRLFFQRILPQIQATGIRKIILDPGICFGKTIEQNFEIVRNLAELRVFGYPILLGLSRKSFIYKTLNIKPEQALNGSCALNMYGLSNGADILRTHDVEHSLELLRLFLALQGQVYGWKYAQN